MTAGTVVIGGRRFRSGGQATLERDLHVMGYLRSAGLDELPMLETETPEQYALRLLAHLSHRTEVLELLGGLLVPEGVGDREWTPRHGHETAVFLKGLTDPAEKKTVHGLICSVLIPFLESGLGSLVRTAAS